MAKYDHGGGCACGLYAECNCGEGEWRKKKEMATYEELKRLFIKFKNRHYSAVQTDTALGYDHDDNRYSSNLRKAKQFWQDADKAEAEFLDLLMKKVT